MEGDRITLSEIESLGAEYYKKLAKIISYTHPATSKILYKLSTDEIRHHEFLNKLKGTPELPELSLLLYKVSENQIKKILAKKTILMSKTTPDLEELLTSVVGIETYEAEGLYWSINHGKNTDFTIFREAHEALKLHTKPFLNELERLGYGNLSRTLKKNLNNQFNVLVIDNDSSSRKEMKYILENDYRLFLDFAETGKEGLEKLGVMQYDAILCDINTPVINTEQFCKLSKKIREKYNTKMIIVGSNLYQAEKLFHCSHEHIPFVGKPINGYNLVKTLREQILYYDF